MQEIGKQGNKCYTKWSRKIYFFLFGKYLVFIECMKFMISSLENLLKNLPDHKCN